MNPSLSDLKIMAGDAGEILRSGFGQKHQIKHKSPRDLTTEIDHRSEAFILAWIKERFPDHSILAEESGNHIGNNQHQWLVDPLDGTINYAHHFPMFSISIAYAYKNEVILGVVYDPIHEECFSAEKGKGAYINDTRVKIGIVRELADSLLVTGFPYVIEDNKNNNMEYFSQLTRLSQGVRRLGSAALDLAYVAIGRLDGFWETQINPWDIAAGALIVQEAGGCVTKLNGESDYLTPPNSIIASNPQLHARLLAVLNQVK